MHTAGNDPKPTFANQLKPSLPSPFENQDEKIGGEAIGILVKIRARSIWYTLE
jgi:hypothetical protein